DELYFHQVIRKFYEKGYLDVIVKFQTTFSTRRINLEEREDTLESINTHLSLVEEPIIEETEFYREGTVLIYNLNNSISSRLNKEETIEIFQKKKLETWGDQIRIGRFQKNVKSLEIYDECLSSHWEDISMEINAISPKVVSDFTPKETNFSRILNEDIEKDPNFLQLVRTKNISINRIAFYTQGQIAYCGYDGTVGILTGLNDRIFYTDVHKAQVVGLTVVGGNIFSIDSIGTLKITSFHKNIITNVGICSSPATVLSGCRDGKIVTGHLDGTIRLWNVKSKQVTICKGHKKAVLAIVIDRDGKIYSGCQNAEFRLWDLDNNKVKIFEGHNAPITSIDILSEDKIVTGTKYSEFKKGKKEEIKGAEIRIIDTKTDICKTVHIRDAERINVINVYFDGRVIAGTKSWENQFSTSNIIVLDIGSDSCQYKNLTGHKIETKDCITMGPRIITCGNESKSEKALRIWGTEPYVKNEYEKLKLMSESIVKPPYYSALF
nr:hypothetical protein [Candidatus Cloacimonadota bacterium]